MSRSIIEMEGIGKRYRLRGRAPGYRTLRDTLSAYLSRPASLIRSRFASYASALRADESASFWALRDVTFDVAEGEVAGLIGRNGAGKSTLLKVLSRITEPSAGVAKVYGRVGSLLEVGTGFHPELTGRENIFFNGSILGMRRIEIERKFDEIVAFAEIERFIDEPVKRYSSGMYTRLAFSVAAHLEPEILFIDEVLAVGDAAFQKKCLGKMGSISRAGRTVLFVSHNMAAVQSLCTRAVWLEAGRVRDLGDARIVVRNYLQTTAKSTSEEAWPDPDCAPGNEKIRLKRVAVIGPEGTSLTVATGFRIEIEFWNYLNAATLNTAVELFNHEEICVLSSFSTPRLFDAGVIRMSCEIPANLLNDATYRLRVFIVREATEQLLVRDSVSFQVHDTGRDVAWFGKWTGVVRPRLDWIVADPPAVEAETQTSSAAVL